MVRCENFVTKGTLVDRGFRDDKDDRGFDMGSLRSFVDMDVGDNMGEISRDFKEG